MTAADAGNARMTHEPGRAVQVEGLTKRYGEVQALAGVNFAVNEG